jgi:hypothetical protein
MLALICCAGFGEPWFCAALDDPVDQWHNVGCKVYCRTPGYARGRCALLNLSSVMNVTAGNQYPLSPMQLGMLFQSLYAPQSGVDIEQLVMGLPEELEVSSLQQAWQALAARHAVLRTSFSWADPEQPLQEVRSAVVVPFEEQDLRALGESQQQARLEAWLREDRRRGFDLGAAPLTRVAVFR